MTKYCPTCDTEYQDHIEFCVDDDTRLTTQKPIHTPIRANGVYAAADEIEAEVIQSILDAEGIAAEIEHSSISQLPLAGSDRFVIVVPDSLRDRALKLLEDARRDDVISLEGLFL